MTAERSGDPGPVSPRVELRREPASVIACCSTVYGNPLAELLIGESFHPGGLESTRQLLAASELKPGTRLLDAGCGPGASSRLAAGEFGLQVDAVDASAEVIAHAESREPIGRVRWRRADLLNLPYESATFDGILAECVLSTLPRTDALIEMRRVLRPGGRLILSDVEVGDDPIPALTDHRILGAALCVTDAWRAGELGRQLGAAGLRIERRWDRTASICALVDRIEARIRLAAVAARDLGLDLGALAGSAGSAWIGPAQAQRLADEVRAAVRRGDLRYFAAVAQADP
ncbi:MAG: methyltransferase domain-containing protein [Chloroflexi bacterium]|nr:methyltransferase domain-containing protein [Chloroflexota bacterium]